MAAIDDIEAVRLAVQMQRDASVAQGIAADPATAAIIAASPSAAYTVLSDSVTRGNILGTEASAPLVREILNAYTPIYSGGTSAGDRQWSNERILNQLIGRPFGGGFIVSLRTDKDGNEFILIDAGASGDSFQREADASGVTGQAGNGQMNWNSNDAVVFSSYNAGEQTDGLFLTDSILDHIRTNNLTFTDWPVFNFISQIRAERLTGRNDWYIPGQASTDNFGTRNGCATTGELGSTTEGESEIADLCWYLLKGMDSGRNWNDDRCYPSHWIPDHLSTFFQTDAGVEAFDDHPYWSSAESGSAAFSLNFLTTLQAATTKSARTFCVRAARRVYL